MRHIKFGLIYPLKGDTVATASEILLALEIGADIQALASVEFPFVLDSAQEATAIPELDNEALETFPDYQATQQLLALHRQLTTPYRFFLPHLRTILQQRADYKKQKADAAAQIYEKLLKEFSNSFYGKFSQAINPRKTYRPATGEMATLSPSVLTEPCVAALTTGLARAALSATLIAVDRFNRGRTPADQVILISATTDGLLLGLPCAEGYSVEADYYLSVNEVPKLNLSWSGLLPRIKPPRQPWSPRPFSPASAATIYSRSSAVTCQCGR